MFSRETIQRLAEEAKDYARKLLPKSTSSLDYNALDVDQACDLDRGMVDVDDQYSSPCVKDILSLESDPYLYRHEEFARIYFKYSLGNCGELAYAALDYFLNDADRNNILVEAYYIEGGDHAFLVVNRNLASDIHAPETWGPDAFICDPWANKVYPAARYLSELKNFNYKIKGGKQENYIEDFNPAYHRLSPIININNHYLKQTRTVSHLEKAFKEKIDKLVTILYQYFSDLNEQIIRLQSESDTQKKIAILEEKKKAVYQELTRLEQSSFSYQGSSSDYRGAREAMRRELKKCIEKCISLLPISATQAAELFQYRDTESKKTKFMRFFSLPTKTESKLKKAVARAYTSIKKL